MSDPVEPLILDLLEWLARAPRPYSEVMEAWRTSCPRLPVWEEANSRGFVERRHAEGPKPSSSCRPRGAVHLAAQAAKRRAQARRARRGRSPSRAKS
jgi:hypothetical protein